MNSSNRHLLVTATLALSSLAAFAGNTWHGTVTAVDDSSQVVVSGVADGGTVGDVVGGGVAAFSGSGLAAKVLLQLTGGAIGSNVKRERTAETVQCTKITFKLDNGEQGDLCLSRWEMNPGFVVGARVLVEAINADIKLSIK